MQMDIHKMAHLLKVRPSATVRAFWWTFIRSMHIFRSYVYSKYSVYIPFPQISLSAFSCLVLSESVEYYESG